MEKEFAQATGRAATAGLTDRQALQSVLTQRANRYLARQLCWVLEIEGLETYILRPRDPADFDLLVEALRPTPSLVDVDIVVGVRGGIAPVLATWIIRSKKEGLGQHDHSFPLARNSMKDNGNPFFSLDSERKTPSDKDNGSLAACVQGSQRDTGREVFFCRKLATP